MSPLASESQIFSQQTAAAAQTLSGHLPSVVKLFPFPCTPLESSPAKVRV